MCSDFLFQGAWVQSTGERPTRRGSCLRRAHWHCMRVPEREMDGTLRMGNDSILDRADAAATNVHASNGQDLVQRVDSARLSTLTIWYKPVDNHHATLLHEL